MPERRADLDIAPGGDVYAGKDSNRSPSARKSQADDGQRTRCMIGMLLDDLGASCGDADGGGISEYRAAATATQPVSLPPEECIDVMTDEFGLRP